MVAAAAAGAGVAAQVASRRSMETAAAAETTPRMAMAPASRSATHFRGDTVDTDGHGTTAVWGCRIATH